ncbi:MAG: hypothetical protein QM778_24475 [Myxococcales bacterium]
MAPSENTSARRSILLAADLLRGDVVELALDHAHLGEVLGIERLGDAEIQQLDVAVVGEEHVLRAHVAVHHLERFAVEPLQIVRVVQTARGLRDDANFLLERQADGPELALCDAQRLPLEILHGDEVATFGLADLVGLHDVRMIQASREARLVEEHVHELFRVSEHVLAQRLHDEQLVKPGGPQYHREVDIGHTALTERCDQTVLAEIARSESPVRRQLHYFAPHIPACPPAGLLRIIRKSEPPEAK